MNKQEAIRRMKREQFQVPYGPGIFVHAVFVDKAIELINQIHEPQKVALPKFVAEWIEIHKKSFAEASAIDMYDNLTLDNSNGYYHDVWLWVVYHHYDFIRAWHEGYEVEQEKLYTVEIPDPNRSDTVTFLYKENGKVFIGSDIFLDEVPNYKWKKDPDNQLTESEIKQDFEWAWEFAEEVE